MRIQIRPHATQSALSSVPAGTIFQLSPPAPRYYLTTEETTATHRTCVTLEDGRLLQFTLTTEIQPIHNAVLILDDQLPKKE